MQFDEGKYFKLLEDSFLSRGLSCQISEIYYLKNSDQKTYTESPISNNTTSNVLWGIKRFRELMPEINKYIPVDTTVSDKGLYCQYVAAEYLSNREKSNK